MFSAEAAPFAKVGGMGDVVGALPKALSDLGVNATVVIPAYASVFETDRFDIRPCKTVDPFIVRLGNEYENAKIYQARHLA